MNMADRAYRLLLRAYPRGFRETFAREMTLCFHDRRREMRAAPVRFWLAMIADVAHSAPALRLDASRGFSQTNFTFEEVRMKAMTIVAILVGALEAVNAGLEGWTGGVVNHAGYSLTVGAMGVVAGALLIAAAVAVLRRTAESWAFARSATAACLAVFVFIGLLRPMFSVAATALGICFPIAFLIFLRMGQGRGSSMPMAA